MKIAVSSAGTQLDSQIDPRFGRCAYFLIVETEDMSFEAFDNENIALGGGAGIQSAQFIASKGAEAVITGSCGPNAVRTLSAAGVKLFVNQSGIVKEAVERHKKGELSPTNKANVPDHYGTGNVSQAVEASAQSFDSGQGTCRGMGMGRGRGMGRGMGMSGWQKTDATVSRDLSGNQNINFLKDQAADLKRQMDAIESQIKQLENNNKGTG